MSDVALSLQAGAGGDLVAPARPRSDRAARWAAAAFGLVLLAALLLPILENWRPRGRDSFPFSYYPMFSQVRPEVQRETYLIGLDAAGQRYTIPYNYAGTGGLVRVRRTIVQGLTRRGRADDLCRTVSRAVARRNAAALRTVQTVQIVTGDFRLSEYFKGNTAPLSEEVNANCVVQRGRT